MPLAQRYSITSTVIETEGWSLYRARSRDDGTSVVVELLDPARGAPYRMERLRREQEVSASLRAAPILHPLVLGTFRGSPALVLADFEGVPLHTLVPGRLTAERFLPLAISVAGALAELHREGIVHRELRPESILVRPDTGEVRLTDLGVSGTPARATPLRTPQVLAHSSLPYVAPEQTGRMNAAVDGRADLYSLGAVFYRLLTGRLPFEAVGALEWVHCHVARIPVAPSEVAADIAPQLSAIVLKLLAKMPDDRYQSAGGLRHDLERCQALLRRGTGAIEPFALAERDRSDRLQLPQKLYGRATELFALLRAFGGASHTGRPALALVTGPAGVGKSALVLELQKRIVGDSGLFVAAKFEQTERDVPYSTFVRAFRELVVAIASRGPARAAAWRDRILRAVGTSGQVLIEVVPALEAVIGPQPPVPTLPPEEARNRFSLVLRRFMGVFAREGHPLALFVDDLQWADPGSLVLLRDLLTDCATRHLLVIGAFRDQEVTAEHPLVAMLADVRRAGTPVTDIPLVPLASEQLTRFIGDALRCDTQEVAPLAALVAEKTAGNPFFAIQFLTELHDERLVEFDSQAGRWRWDVDRIRAKGFTDNVVDLMIAKLRRLPPAAIAVVQQAAAIGSATDLPTLAAIHERGLDETRADIAEAVHAGLVVAGGDGYRLVHDRVQEAAYSLVPPGERAALHLRIGRLLLLHLGEAGLDSRIFDVVSQLDRGLALVTDPREREDIVRLNLRAAHRARDSVAFAAARSYFRCAAELLPADAWRQQHAETFTLVLDLAECEYLAGDFARADARLDEVLAHTEDRRERARAYGVRMRLYQVEGRWPAAVAVAIEALRPFGVVFPESDGAAAEVIRQAIEGVPALLRGRRIADLIDSPVVTDPDVRATVTLLVAACPATNIARPALFPLVVLTALRLSLEHGNTEDSCFAYSAWATLLVALVGDAATANEFSKMSLRLNERLGDPRLQGTLLYLHANFVHFWNEPLTSGFPIQERSLEACLRVGEFVFAGYLLAHKTWHILESGQPLDRVLAGAREHMGYARLALSEVMVESVQLMAQVALSLQGSTRAPASLDDDSFSIDVFLDRARRSGFLTGAAYGQVCRLTAAALYGHWEAALDIARESEPLLPAIAAQLVESSYHCYLALALAALSGRAGERLRPEIANRLPAEVRRLERWAAANPVDYTPVLEMVRAELARAEGHDLEAVRHYEDAVAGARQAGATHKEALASELAAAFYLERGLERLSDLCLREARDAWARWGAHGKVGQLERQHPFLLASRPSEGQPGPSPTLDLLSVVKASQTISREIEVERLVGTLLEVALELGGARRGCLVLVRGDDLVVEAEATLDGERVATRTVGSEPIDGSTRVPASIVRRAWLTREPVIVDDATVTADPDPYVVARCPRSVLALPVGQQARMVGVLLLENELVAGAFTPERLTALELIGFQAAISVENARLFREARSTSAALAAANEKLEAEARERERAEADRAAAEAQLRQAQKMQSIGLLAGGVAHDFNNLLTPILGNSECIVADLSPAHPHHELATEIFEAAERARDLTRQLLAVGRRQMLALEPQDLRELVTRFERMIRRMVREDIRIDVSMPADLGVVRADAGQLGQVLLNLSVNAQDAMAQQGVLTISARNETLGAGDARPEGLDPGRFVVLCVADTGCGMDLETRERLFEPFFTTKERGRGTGLGLSTVYGIVRQHGGSVVVHSAPGEGSRFEVYLPRLGDDAPHPTSRGSTSPVGAARSAGETVLVVEDDAPVRSTACQLLRRLGYRVLAAGDLEGGERALRDAGGRVDLLLSDVIMPGGNGKQVFERLRESCPGLRVLYMSGYATDVVVHRGVVDEGVHFIQKPLTLERLGVEIRKALDA